MVMSKARRIRQRANRRPEWAKTLIACANKPVNVVGVAEERFNTDRHSGHSDPVLRDVINSLIRKQKKAAAR